VSASILKLGERVQVSNNSGKLDMKQWIMLRGEATQRAKCKKYITSMCSPEYVQKIELNASLLERIEKGDLLSTYISSNQVYFQLINKPNEPAKLVIQGTSSDVYDVKLLIDITNKNEEKCAPSSPFAVKSDQNEDVICISDPYEIFDQRTKTINLNKKTLRDSQTLQNNELDTSDVIFIEQTPSNESASRINEIAGNSKLLESNFQKLNFMQEEEPVLNLKNYNALIKIGVANGYQYHEIEKAIGELNPSCTTSNEFLDYLKMTCKSNAGGSSLQKSSSACSKIAMSPSISSICSSSKKMNLNPSPSFEGVTKQLNNDAAAISNQKSQAQSNRTNQKSPTIMKEALSEYAQMIHTQEFDNQKSEKKNKALRISKLIEAMPDEQKANAISQMSKYSNKTNLTREITSISGASATSTKKPANILNASDFKAPTLLTSINGSNVNKFTPAGGNFVQQEPFIFASDKPTDNNHIVITTKTTKDKDLQNKAIMPNAQQQTKPKAKSGKARHAGRKQNHTRSRSNLSRFANYDKTSSDEGGGVSRDFKTNKSNMHNQPLSTVGSTPNFSLNLKSGGPQL
jgi:hypothetical protein